MPFINCGLGGPSPISGFSERLISHLALEGTEITRQVLNPAPAQMHVNRTTYVVEPVKRDFNGCHAE